MAIFWERGQRFWFAPTHRAAERSAACTQSAQAKAGLRSDRAQIGGGKARSRKAQQHPAVFDPVGQGFGLQSAKGGHIGQHDHVGVGQKDIIAERAVDQIGGRRSASRR